MGSMTLGTGIFRMVDRKGDELHNLEQVGHWIVSVGRGVMKRVTATFLNIRE